MKLFILGVSLAHAGWLGRWCEKQFTMQYPFSYETTPIEYVLKAFDELCIKARWKKLAEADQDHLDHLTDELKRREAYSSAYQRGLATEALARCQ